MVNSKVNVCGRQRMFLFLFLTERKHSLAIWPAMRKRKSAWKASARGSHCLLGQSVALSCRRAVRMVMAPERASTQIDGLDSLATDLSVDIFLMRSARVNQPGLRFESPAMKTSTGSSQWVMESSCRSLASISHRQNGRSSGISDCQVKAAICRHPLAAGGTGSSCSVS